MAADPATLAKKRAAQLLVVEDPTRPVLHRRAGSEGDRPAAPKSGAPDADGDPDRPVLHRRDEAGDEKPTGANGTAASPTLSASARQPEAGRQNPRPQPAKRRIIRFCGAANRRKSKGGSDLPEFNPALVPALNPGTGEAGVRGPAPMARQVAVSDAGTSEPQDVTFVCPPEQRRQMEALAHQLAEDELRKAASMRGLVLPDAPKASTAQAAKTGSAKTKTAAASKAKAAAPGTQPTSATAEASAALTFDDEQFVPYALDFNDYATVVFSARYRPSAEAAGNASLPAAGAGAGNASLPAAGAGAGNAALPAAGALGKSWVVTVIARQDGDKLVKQYSAVSDPKELDLYPEVRLVDAVDPDGYGRYALLFREQGRDGVRWRLGRVSGYELQTLFETAAR